MFKSISMSNSGDSQVVEHYYFGTMLNGNSANWYEPLNNNVEIYMFQCKYCGNKYREKDLNNMKIVMQHRLSNNSWADTLKRSIMDSEINNWHKFFEELGSSLNKYNFMISEFVLGVSVDNRIRVVSFNSDGKKVYPVYSIPEDVQSVQQGVQLTALRRDWRSRFGNWLASLGNRIAQSGGN